jgi:hypothetical protein
VNAQACPKGGAGAIGESVPYAVGPLQMVSLAYCYALPQAFAESRLWLTFPSPVYATLAVK